MASAMRFEDAEAFPGHPIDRSPGSSGASSRPGRYAPARSEVELTDYRDERTYRATRMPLSVATTITPDAYRSTEFFEVEREQVFAGGWVAVGLCSEVVAVGQTIVRNVAGRSIMVVMGVDGVRRGFLNVCRHRGAQLVPTDCTLARRIRCPYHAWAYAFDGECIGTPLFEDSDIPEDHQAMFDTADAVGFDKADHGLFEVRVEAWGALLFADLSGTAMPLSEWLGDLPARLDGYGFESWEVQREKTYDIGANWKLIAENFMEYYHLPWVHPELMKVSRMEDHHRFQGPGLYTGMCTSPISQADTTDGWSGLVPAPGVSGSDLESGRFIHLFPNVSISVLPNHAFLMFLEPVEPGRTVERTHLLAHPESVSDPAAVDRLHEFWDHVNAEDIEIVERVQRGVSIPEYPGGRMCYRFEEPLHRFQNMLIDRMVGIERVPEGDDAETSPMFGSVDGA